MPKTVVGLFENPQLVDDAVREIEALGFPRQEVRTMREPASFDVTGIMSFPRIDFEVDLSRELARIGATMRESMARLTPRFSANRAVCEYAEKHYIPAAAAYRVRAADKGAVGKQVVDWRQALEQRWSTLRLREVTVKTDPEHHTFVVQVFTGELDPNFVRVELYADGNKAIAPIRQEMKRCRESEASGFVYAAQVPAARASADYTVRVIPHFCGAAVPLEAPQILWQRR